MFVPSRALTISENPHCLRQGSGQVDEKHYSFDVNETRGPGGGYAQLIF